jgi:hypothetical protein
VHKPIASQVPVDETGYRPDRIEGEPKHQVFWAVSSIDGNNFFHTHAHIIH